MAGWQRPPGNLYIVTSVFFIYLAQQASAHLTPDACPRGVE